MSTSLLKLVNSSFYGGASKISNLATAVTRLGMRDTRNLILAVGVRSVFRNMPKDQADERDRLWRHSSLTAVLCGQINEKMGLGFNGEEFAAGLAHDLGRIMLAVGFPDVFAKLAKARFIDEGKLIVEEQRMLGFTHCDLGSWLANVWNLPGDLVDAIQYHHDPVSAGPHAVLSAVVCIAEEMANHIEAARRIEGISLTGNFGWDLLRSRWPNLEHLDADLFATAVMADAVPEAETLAAATT